MWDTLAALHEQGTRPDPVTITEAGVTALMGWAVRAHFAHRAPVDAARP